MGRNAAVFSPPARVAPGPRPHPLLGNMMDINRQGVIGFAYQAWREYGDVCRFQFGPMRAQLFVRPEAVHHIMAEKRQNYIKGASHDKMRLWLGKAILTSEGADWQRQRRLMQPTYTPRGVMHFANLMTDAIQQVEARWLAHAGRAAGEAINVNAEMVRMTTSIISLAMFGEDISDTARTVDEALQTILSQTVQRMTAIIDPPLFIPTPANRRFQWAERTLDAFVYDIIQRRRRLGSQAQSSGDDLLWLLIQARDEETGAVMDDRQLRDEVMVTFFAGHDTSAQLLTWCWYLLAQNEAVEEKLHAELERVLAGRTPTLDDVPQLTYTRMVLDEALRLYPPVAMFPRDVLADDTIDGYAVPAKSMVFVGPYMTHRHPEFWERPLEFYPEHFTPEQVERRPRYAYYPFSAGPRTCIGNHFALLEATLALAELAQRVRLRLAPGQRIEPEFVGTLRPVGARLMMRVEER